MTAATDAVRPVFVLGSPRSGTTMVAVLLGSSPRICYLGEYLAFHFTLVNAPELFASRVSRFTGEYVAELQQHARDFACRVAIGEGCRLFLDDSPWNLLAVPQIEKLFASDEPLYVLCYRHPAAVVRSLRVSERAGRTWAGPDDDARAHLWASFYAHVAELPRARTVLFDYDATSRDPSRAVESLVREVADRLSLPVSDFNHEVLLRSHASSGVAGKTFLVRNGDALNWRARPELGGSADRVELTAARRREVSEVVDTVRTHLGRPELLDADGQPGERQPDVASDSPAPRTAQAAMYPGGLGIDLTTHSANSAW